LTFRPKRNVSPTYTTGGYPTFTKYNVTNNSFIPDFRVDQPDLQFFNRLFRNAQYDKMYQTGSTALLPPRPLSNGGVEDRCTGNRTGLPDAG
jgi:hypothetical protein